jgi:PPOX class probable F420-dependent enzyme
MMLARLGDHDHVSIGSCRRDGTVVWTPVWFVIDGGRLLLRTMAASGKVARIRREPRVEVAPCNADGELLGEASPGLASIVTDAEIIARADRRLDERYGEARREMTRLMEEQRAPLLYIEVALTE